MDDSSLIWDDGALVTIDQRGLPHEVRELRLGTVDEIIDAIKTLAIRGAPAIGIAGAFAVVLATAAHTVDGVVDIPGAEADAERIAQARPTAVNLAWAVRRVLREVPLGADAVLAEAQAMLIEDGRVNRAAATHAADLVQRLCPDRPLRVLTHCNTGRLATSAFGTALGALRVLSDRGAIADVLVDETRPLLQGARLTTWELAEAGIPHRLTIDSAAAWAMATGQVDCVLVGADRITANGDVANKIGTYMLALAARHHGIPFIVVAPESTRDPNMATGRDIVVEQRGAAEVTEFGSVPTAPDGTPVFNPAFDVTPAALVTAVVTELGVAHGGVDPTFTADTYTVPGTTAAAPGNTPKLPGTTAISPSDTLTLPSTAATSPRDTPTLPSTAATPPGITSLPGATATPPRNTPTTRAEAATDGTLRNGNTATGGGDIGLDETCATPGGPGTAIATVAREMYRRGWMPGTAGNISVRADDTVVVTGSGLSKGELTAADMVRVRVTDSAPLPDQARKPSAETTIHTAVYRTTAASAVVHIHPPYATTVATRFGAPDAVTTVRITDFELIKGLVAKRADGTYPAVLDLPVFPNWPEVARIGADIEAYLAEQSTAAPVLGIAGHGITAWGDNLSQARDRAECLEALCELVVRTGRRQAYAGARSDVVPAGPDFLQIGPIS